MQDLTILIKPASSLCNMHCAYCFYADVSAHRAVHSYGIMTEEVLETLTRRAFAAAERSLTFVFQGGEPLLAGLDFFRTVIALQKKYNSRGIAVYNTLQTNGTLIDNEFAVFFAENRFLVGVSLDGDRVLHDTYRRFPNGSGSYDRVLAGIDLLQKHGVDFNILAVISKKSAENPAAVYESLKKYRYLQFIPLIDDFGSAGAEFSPDAAAYGRFLTETFALYHRDIMRGTYVSVRDFDSYIHMVRGLPPSSCAMQGRCGGYFTVEADGGVYPCDFYVTDEYKIGNITESSFFSLAKSEKLRDFVVSSVCTEEKCRGCTWFSLCRGGCRRHREPFPSVTRFCEAYTYFFAQSIGKMREIAALVEKNTRQNGGRT